MKLADFKVLTLDCYGTLIDWETGIHNGLQSLVAKARIPSSRDQVLELFAQEDETPSIPYSQLLSVVYRRLAKFWGVAVANEEANTFGASVPDWPEFSDSVDALKYLKQRYKLVILSNVDRISFRASNVRLQVAFDGVYTAQDIESYNPNPRNFEYMLRRLRDDFGLEKTAVLHTAQSLFHDHALANHGGHADDRKGSHIDVGRWVNPMGKRAERAAEHRAHE
jgi:2-haloalkanoic acid dehalogenase type II